MAQKRKTCHSVNRKIRAAIGALLVLVITFSAISICQNAGRSFKVDITERKLYTLSGGTKAILARLNQPIKMKLYYAKTAALKAPDSIRYFNNYYEFVKALLEEYVAAAKGMIELEIIDPRPFSDDEVQALRYGLERYSVTQDENFFFGLVVQTPFGVENVIKFFSPDRQSFVEYDISYLVDTAVTRQKKVVGIMSSLPVMGEDVSGYMAQMMRLQGQQPKPAWTFVQQLRSRYELESVSTDVNDINGVDILLVIHPKELPEKTLFAIDQFVLKGGRTIVCVDPHCVVDRPSRMAMQMMGTLPSQSSQLNVLLRTWGLEMTENAFVGDRNLMMSASLGDDGRSENVIGFLGLGPGCFNTDNVITANLNHVRVLFAGELREIADPNQTETTNIERTKLVMTTGQGNTVAISGQFELLFPDPSKLISKFFPGNEPVPMGYLVTGRFKSGFPDGIEVEQKSEDPNETGKIKKQIKGLTQAQQDCAVVVFADVDFISDMLAYYDFSIFGKAVAGDNSALLLNAIEDLTGSADLIAIRSRGSFRQPFTVVDRIEKEAEAETANEVAKLNAQIAGFTKELQNILASSKGEEAEVIGSTILQKQRDIELKKLEAQRQLNEIKLNRRKRTEHLGNVLRNFNMLIAPAVILVIAVVLGIRRSVRKRHYISHASDA